MAQAKQIAVPGRSLILLDRDGVINKVVVDPEHGTVDSPLHPSQVEIFPWVPSAVAGLTAAGFDIAIVTNQPSWAKGKTTRQNLLDVHEEIIKLATSAGGRIASSHICFHRAEDLCSCRKPKPGLLIEAFERCPGAEPSQSWMAGDGITDVVAGSVLGLKTAFIGARKCDGCQLFDKYGVNPIFWGQTLADFVDFILVHGGSGR